jgi:hypothetical protein
MSIIAQLRLGIGFDIEHNEINRYCMTDEEGKDETIVCFVGLIIKIPFIEILIGEFFTE